MGDVTLSNIRTESLPNSPPPSNPVGNTRPFFLYADALMGATYATDGDALPDLSGYFDEVWQIQVQQPADDFTIAAVIASNSPLGILLKGLVASTGTEVADTDTGMAAISVPIKVIGKKKSGI